MQKVQFIIYSGKEVFANDHFYYPFEINNNAEFRAYLLHYKFLPGDEEKYNIYAKDGRHWNNSREYIIYKNFINKRITLYDKNVSILIDDIDYNF